MRFDIGDHIYNKITQEEGRIVRIADTSIGSAYIVSINRDASWGKTTREALWKEAEVKASEAERAQP